MDPSVADTPTSRAQSDQHVACWDAFLEAATLLYRKLDTMLADAHRLGVCDIHLLQVIAEGGGARMGELADAVSMSFSHVTQQVQRLEAQGLVIRTRLRSDRRVVVVAMTANGRARLARALGTYAKAVRRYYLGPLSRQQMTALGAASQRISAGLRGGNAG